MTTLKDFLEDTYTALENGFGKKENILRMFNALYEVWEAHKPSEEDIPRCPRCVDATIEDGIPKIVMSIYPCEIIKSIEKELQ